MKGAAGAASKPRAIEKDACPVHDSGIRRLLVREDPTSFSFGSELKQRRVDHRGEGADHSRLVLTIEFGAHRTTALLEFLGWFIMDTKAAPTPDAGPIRVEEVGIE